MIEAFYECSALQNSCYLGHWSNLHTPNFSQGSIHRRVSRHRPSPRDTDRVFGINRIDSNPAISFAIFGFTPFPRTRSPTNNILCSVCYIIHQMSVASALMVWPSGRRQRGLLEKPPANTPSSNNTLYEYIGDRH